MSRSFTIDREQIREVVKRVIERSSSGEPISFPRSNSRDDAPTTPAQPAGGNESPRATARKKAKSA
jgi:hypothetical protein